MNQRILGIASIVVVAWLLVAAPAQAQLRTGVVDGIVSAAPNDPSGISRAIPTVSQRIFIDGEPYGLDSPTLKIYRAGRVVTRGALSKGVVVEYQTGRWRSEVRQLDVIRIVSSPKQRQ